MNKNEQLQMAMGTSPAGPAGEAAVGGPDLRATDPKNQHGLGPQAGKTGSPALVRGEGNSWR